MQSAKYVSYVCLFKGTSTLQTVPGLWEANLRVRGEQSLEFGVDIMTLQGQFHSTEFALRLVREYYANSQLMKCIMAASNKPHPLLECFAVSNRVIIPLTLTCLHEATDSRVALTGRYFQQNTTDIHRRNQANNFGMGGGGMNSTIDRGYKKLRCLYSTPSKTQVFPFVSLYITLIMFFSQFYFICLASTRQP